MSKPWPPPPDLPSLQELMRAADPGCLIAQGLPADEYDPEERAFFAAIAHLPTAELLATNLLPILESIWAKSFGESDLIYARPALLSLAQQVERFFGPAAQPQTRVSESITT